MQSIIFKKTGFFSVITALVILISSCSSSKNKSVIKLAHGLDQTHSVHKAMVYMGERLKEKSNGKLTIQIYPGGQLGSERETLELLQIGSLGITKVSSPVLEGFIDEYKVLGLPYLFENKEHFYTVLDGEIGKQFLLSGEDIWLRGLCFYDAGSRSFYTKDKPIHEPDDLKGMKIRVMKSITAMKMVNALGGSPTPISWGELYTALQSGVVDGAENNPPSFFLSRHYEVCKYYSIDEHSSVPDVLLISKHIWDKLDTEEKQWVQEAADESALYQRILWQESEREALEGLRREGVEIIYPDKSKFSALALPIYDQLITHEESRKLIQAIREESPLKKENNNEREN
jgi:tripartite ATP-independent transporter DctP family solute receptor